MRTDPTYFVSILEKEAGYFDGKVLKIPGEINLMTNEGKPAWDEGIAYLKTATKVGALANSKGMNKACMDHVKDQAGGATGHTGSDGSSPFDRMNKYG